ncbi:hypothetical protein [Haloarchaeobius sp. HME9146]|uniref:hypothetical protein n=1 Tax=Haloarchaeobius sp. HME9146 TaxID=2978732 RepID=UPI0021BF6173|nr:hypothetical protein [Haloarchaeobius sp. HME9146]MCT9095068.1 hypothetical protein [Haloarchaeobius sp. HME9146]
MDRSRSQQQLRESGSLGGVDRVSRRSLLSATVGAVIATAGCMNGSSTSSTTESRDEPTASLTTAAQGRTQTETGAPTAASTADAVRIFRSNLRSAEIDVESLTYDDATNRVELSYVSAEPGSRETVTTEVGIITAEFYNTIAAGLRAQRLDSTIIGPEGTDQLRWYAEREWFTEFQDGKISEDELILRVIETVEQV